MYKSTARNHRARNTDYVLTKDFAKIKDILALTARDIKHKAGDAFTDSVTNIKEKSVDLKENTASYIAEKPFKALFIALGSGVLLGFILRQKSRRR